MRRGVAVWVILLIIFTFGLTVSAQESVGSIWDGKIVDVDSFLRLRAQPSVESLVVTNLDPRVRLMITRKTRDGLWYEARIPDGLVGWVSADYVQLQIEPEIIPIADERSTPGHGYYLTPSMAENIDRIFRKGQKLGNRPNVFSKIGDSLTFAPHTLQPIGEGLYDLADYDYLEDVIEYYSVQDANTANSFLNESLAAQIGWTSQAVLETKRANPDVCLKDETPLTCEYRVVKPSIALILFGTNDVGLISPDNYEKNLTQIIEISEEMGVIPVLSTIPVRLGYEEEVAYFNRIVFALTRQYGIPLWDYGAAMQDLPNFGLDIDGVHPSVPPNGYKGAADFSADNLYYGYVIRNLTALQMLDVIWHETYVPLRTASS